MTEPADRDATDQLLDSLLDRHPAHTLMYLIWSNQQCRWWRPNGRGYTNVIEWAGRYPYAEAQAILAKCSIGAQTTVRDPLELNRSREVPNEVLVPAPESVAALLNGWADGRADAATALSAPDSLLRSAWDGGHRYAHEGEHGDVESVPTYDQWVDHVVRGKPLRTNRSIRESDPGWLAEEERYRVEREAGH